MLCTLKYYILAIFCISGQYFLQAQTVDSGNLFPDPGNYTDTVEFKINNIIITGNKKTKRSILLREMPFRVGESYFATAIDKKMEHAQRQLINTSLFHTVELSRRPAGFTDTADASNQLIDILVEVKERWYIFPVPFIKPVDRNLNQWLFEQNAKMERVNYGIRVKYNNVTGRNDKFRMGVTSGYTRQLSFNYDRPFIDRQMKWGLNTGFSYGKTHEMNYNTIGDKQVFLKDDHFVRSYLNVEVAVSYRRAIRTRHHFGISYSFEKISDTIVGLNPSYFKPGRNSTGYPTFYYTLDYFDLNYNAYPTSGYALRVSLSKSGLNNTINCWQLHAKGTAYLPLSPKSFFQATLYGGIKLPFHQPWTTQRFLGFGDTYLQGYEYYVIDGVAGGFFKATAARQLLKFGIAKPGSKKRKETDKIPFTIYGKIFGNAGYVYSPEPRENELSNRILLSAGIGLDIVTIYDVTLRLEWSFNQLGQNGLFLHPKTIF